MGNWEFKNPWFLLLLLIVPIYLFLKYRARAKSKFGLALPSIQGVEAPSYIYQLLYTILPLLTAAMLSFLIVAFARPQIPLQNVDVNNEKGIDIILAVDVSLSMLSKDLEPDRLTALKEVAKKFVLERKTDRVGLVAYAAEAITKVPLTTDKEVLLKEIEDLSTFQLDQGTAIGVGLATAVNHLKDSKAKSRIIILLTDGENNSGAITPETAADIASSKGIKVYTIGVGKQGEILSPTGSTDIFGNLEFRRQPSNLDEGLLRHIANQTHAKYFRATSKQVLAQVYQEINQLEKSNVSALKYRGYEEKYRKYVLWALVFLGLELLLRTFIFKSV